MQVAGSSSSATPQPAMTTSPGSRRVSPTSSQRASVSTSPLRPISFENAPSPRDTASSKSFAFPPAPVRVPNPAQRASLVVRTRRSSPLLHEIQGPSRRLSSHQMLLLTPFGGHVPVEAMSEQGSPGGRMARVSSSMGNSRMDGRSTSLGTGAGGASMTPSYSSVGMGREVDPSPSVPRALPTMSTRFNTRHQSLVQPVNPSPLSQPMTTIQSASEHGSESGSSSRPISRETSNSSSGTNEDLGETSGGSAASTVPMTRSNSLPVLTQRELDAMTDKDGELGIARGSHWAWVSTDAPDDLDEEIGDSPVPRTTPPTRQFAFQDPFAPLGTFAMQSAPGPRQVNPTTTSDDYHYSPTAEARRMSEATSGWSSITPTSFSPPGSAMGMVDRSRGASVATITLSGPKSNTPPSPFKTFESQTQSRESESPPIMPEFNTRASMSAIEHDPYVNFTSPDALVGQSPLTRPRILRYKTSPARFTGLGLDIVVKAQTPAPASGRRTSTAAPGSSVKQYSNALADRRRSSQLSTEDSTRRRSSGTSASSSEGRRGTGTWAVVDVVESLSISTISTTTPTTSSPSSSFISHQTSRSSVSVSASPMANTVFTVEHVSSRSSPLNSGSIPSRKGKTPVAQVQGSFGYDTISPLMGAGVGIGGIMADPLAFPRRGSLAVLSQTALGPWASKAAVKGDELLGAPKGNWQDRRGSWAEGWSRK